MGNTVAKDNEIARYALVNDVLKTVNVCNVRGAKIGMCQTCPSDRERRRRQMTRNLLEAISTLFMSSLRPAINIFLEWLQGAVQSAGGTMFKRCNTANAVFREQPKGLVSVFVHFCVARRSHAAVHHPNHFSRLELHKNGHPKGHE